MTRKGPGDGEPGNLLPARARLLIFHQEVLVIDTSQMKAQGDSVHSSSKHQTGVAERSIRRDDRYTTESVIDDVVIRHDTN